MENSKCCPPSSDNNANCCDSEPKQKKNGLKQKIGLAILGLAVVLGISAASTPASSCDPSSANCAVGADGDQKCLSPDKKVSYILLKGSDAVVNEKLTEKVTEVVDEINATEGAAEVLIADASDEDYQKLIDKAEVQDFPAVLVVGLDAQVEVFTGKIRLIALVRAYDSAAASCATKSSCCPKK